MSPCEFGFVPHHPLGPLSLEFRLSIVPAFDSSVDNPQFWFFQKFEFKEQFDSSFFNWKKKELKNLKEPMVLMKGISKGSCVFRVVLSFVIIY